MIALTKNPTMVLLSRMSVLARKKVLFLYESVCLLGKILNDPRVFSDERSKSGDELVRLSQLRAIVRRRYSPMENSPCHSSDASGIPNIARFDEIDSC